MRIPLRGLPVINGTNVIIIALKNYTTQIKHIVLMQFLKAVLSRSTKVRFPGLVPCVLPSSFSKAVIRRFPTHSLLRFGHLLWSPLCRLIYLSQPLVFTLLAHMLQISSLQPITSGLIWFSFYSLYQYWQLHDFYVHKFIMQAQDTEDTWRHGTIVYVEGVA